MAESSAYARRGFSGSATATTLSSGIGTGDTTIPCTSLTTWSSTYTNGPATAIITEGTTVEIVEFTGISGNSLTTVTRGVGGTSAASFSAGATVEHGSRDRDFNEANYWISELAAAVTAAGDLMYADGDNSLARLAKGTSGQFLKQGASAPSWASLAITDIDITMRRTITFHVVSPAVTSGATGFVAPVRISVPSGRELHLRKATYWIRNGTNVVLDVKKGTAPGSLSDITGFTDLTATTTSATTDPTDVLLADGDFVGIDIDSVSGSPDNLVVWLDCEETNA